MYHKLGVTNATWVLFALSVLVCIPVYVIYKKGPQIRARSKYAKEVEAEKQSNAVARGLVAEDQGMLEVRA